MPFYLNTQKNDVAAEFLELADKVNESLTQVDIQLELMRKESDLAMKSTRLEHMKDVADTLVDVLSLVHTLMNKEFQLA